MEIIRTEDGSHTIYLQELNETYHSRHGAIQEALHVYISHGLEYFDLLSQIHTMTIFELGLGTGLNALLTQIYALQNKKSIYYQVIEPNPLEKIFYSKLNYGGLVQHDNAKEILNGIHEAPWNTPVKLNPWFELVKMNLSLQDFKPVPDSAHIIYYDAFAPAKQPEMWKLPLLKKAYYMLRSNGILVTYCAQGQLKRDLKETGFKVETLPGPPGKKEMVRAIKF